MGLESHISGEVFDMIVHNNDSKDTTIPLIQFKYAVVNLTIQTCYPSMVQSSKHSVSWWNISSLCGCSWTKRCYSKVISTIDDTAFPSTTLRDSQYLQQLANNTKLSYTMFSLSQSVTVRLQAEGTPCDFWWHIYTSYLCSRLKLGRPTWIKHFWVKKILCLWKTDTL